MRWWRGRYLLFLLIRVQLLSKPKCRWVFILLSTKNSRKRRIKMSWYVRYVRYRWNMMKRQLCFLASIFFICIVFKNGLWIKLFVLIVEVALRRRLILWIRGLLSWGILRGKLWRDRWLFRPEWRKLWCSRTGLFMIELSIYLFLCLSRSLWMLRISINDQFFCLNSLRSWWKIFYYTIDPP